MVVGLSTARSHESPSASENLDWFRAFQSFTVLTVFAVLQGSASPSVTFTVKYDTDRSGVGTVIGTGTVTSTTLGQTFTITTATIPAGNHVWLETSAQSGTVLSIKVALELAVP